MVCIVRSFVILTQSRNALNLVVRLFLCYFTIVPMIKGVYAIITYETREALEPSDIRDIIEQSLDADKAFDILSIDLRDQTAIADYMIIASGTSSRHVSALAGKLKDRLGGRGVKDIRIEGAGSSDWVVMDAGDVIVHLFRPEVREFYNIEKMWGAHSPVHVVSSEDQVLA